MHPLDISGGQGEGEAWNYVHISVAGSISGQVKWRLNGC